MNRHTGFAQMQGHLWQGVIVHELATCRLGLQSRGKLKFLISAQVVSRIFLFRHFLFPHFQRFSRDIYTVPAEVRSIVMLCYVCVSVREHISETTIQNFTKTMTGSYSGGDVVGHDKSFTSGFVNDVMFFIMDPWRNGAQAMQVMHVSSATHQGTAPGWGEV